MRKIKIFDTTLRDGEQAPGASLNTEEKIRIARSLDELGVDIIEAGFAAASLDDKNAIMEIGKVVKKAQVCSLARAIENDIKEAGEAIKKAKNPRLHTFISTSEIHMQYQIKKTPKEVLEITKKAVSLAKNYCDDVEFSAMDSTRSEMKFLLEVFEMAVKNGAKTLNIADTVGYMTPWVFADFVKKVVDHFKNSDITISVHCHDDLGMATANSLSAVHAGAGQIECAMNGLGERAGNTSLEEVVMAIKTRRDIFQADTNIKAQNLVNISKMVSALTGFPVPPNKAIVGKNAFAHESGIHQDGVLKHRETYEIMSAEDVGWQKNALVLGKHSGRAALKDHYKNLGLELSEEELMTIFKRFKDLADRKKEIFDEDLEAILEDERGKIGQKYELDLLQVSTGNKMVPTATIRIMEDGKKELIGVANGTGPVDALCNAIDSVTKEKNRLTEFSVKAVTAGIDAVAEVTIKIEKDGRIYTGYGADADIVYASARAYLNALNRSIRQRKK